MDLIDIRHGTGYDGKNVTYYEEGGGPGGRMVE